MLNKKIDIKHGKYFLLILFLIINAVEFYITRADILDKSKPLNYTTFVILLLTNHMILVIYGYFALIIFNIKANSLLDLYLYALIIGYPLLIVIVLLLSLLKMLDKISLLIVASAIILFTVYLTNSKKYKVNISRLNTSDMILSLIILYSFIHFTRIAYSLNVTPPGDGYTYGMSASLIYYNKGLPETYYPLCNWSFYKFPHNILRLGFPFLVALGSSISGILSIHMVVVIAALISYTILVASVLFMYKVTKRTNLAVLTFLLLYIVPNGMITPPFSNNDPTLSNLINGTYSQHLGNLLTILFFFLVYLISKHQINNRKFTSFSIVIYLIVIVFSNIRALPIFIITLLVYLYDCLRRNIKINIVNKKIYIVSFLVSLILLMYFANNFYLQISRDVMHTLGINPRSTYMSLEDIIERRPFHLVVMIAAVLSILPKVVKRKGIKGINIIDIIFIVLFASVIVSTSEYIYVKYLWFISSMRLFLVVYMLSIIVLVMNLGKIDKFRGIIIMVIASMILLQISGIYFNFVYTSPKWMRIYEPTYSAIEFLLNISQPTDLILNDPNYIGYAIPLFRPQNLTCDRTFLFILTSTNNSDAHWYLERAREAIYVLKNPTDKNAFLDYIKKYGVKYIFLSQYNAYYDPFLHKYVYKSVNLSYTEYLKIFDKNSCLQIIFDRDNLRIYKVRDECR